MYSWKSYCEQKLGTLWHKQEEHSGGETREGAEGHKYPPAVVLKAGAVVANL